MKVIVESPLNAPTPQGFQDNLRYLLWCLRAEVISGNSPIASHLGAPFYLDDKNPKERQQGYDNQWFWDDHARDVLRHFWIDRGESSGMLLAKKRCEERQIIWYRYSLAHNHPEMWAAFQRGEWPPHTPGFAIERVTEDPPLSEFQEDVTLVQNALEAVSE